MQPVTGARLLIAAFSAATAMRASIDRLIADVRARVPLDAGCEITLEANPGTFERDRFAGYRAAGLIA